FRWFRDFAAAQSVLASPLLFPLLVGALAIETRRALRERDLATLAPALTADVFLVVFTAVSLVRFSAPHWSAPALAPGAIVTARWALRRWPEWRAARRRLTLAALASGMVLVAAAHGLLFVIDLIPRGLAYEPEKRRVTTDNLDFAY